MINLTDANTYFSTRLHSDEWTNALDNDKTSALTTAENMLLNTFTLREGYQDIPAYLHAVCEQAIHLLQFDKERYRLQQEGVSSYGVDDQNFNMSYSIISPIVKAFLKPLIYKKAGDVVGNRDIK
ncbi:hypothetical protein [Schinkia azotoformans]|uniref:hypothetical protein n=1 Tax=Schinkia azotoformans TaxID=1454 RepID=UPI002DBB1082|nr:hypothetical protein [Schinkia azotoformans]MEC1786082.1 hypothetical protein [Schinkia azotoformans]MED4420118.1 hypothetical protein [Schinkia azotoformans]